MASKMTPEEIARKKSLFLGFGDMFAEFFYYSRKNDEDASPEDLKILIAEGHLTREEMKKRLLAEFNEVCQGPLELPAELDTSFTLAELDVILKLLHSSVDAIALGDRTNKNPTLSAINKANKLRSETIAETR